jgi:predicted nucleotidyltransferase
MSEHRFSLLRETIAEFCQRWQVKEFAIFGSALRDDFDALSDIDVLVSFDDSAEITLLDWLKCKLSWTVSSIDLSTWPKRRLCAILIAEEKY